MVRGMETVNISKASTFTNLFYLFYHGGKAAIIPFLTLFFRLVGLGPLEAGAIIAAKTLTGLVWAPLWSRCATVYNRHRLVLIFSLFMMMATYLSFPALYTQLAKPEQCYQRDRNNSVDQVHQAVQPGLPSNPNDSKSSQEFQTTMKPENFQSMTPATSTGTSSTSTATTTTTSTSIFPNEKTSPTPEQDDTPESFTKSNMTANDLYPMIKDKLGDKFDVKYKAISQRYDALKAKSEQHTNKEVHEETQDQAKHRRKRDGWTDLNQLKDKLRSIQSSLQNDKVLLFLVILAIIVGGEIFASPVEKVADDAWFDFLNRIDDLERYGQQRFWGSVAFVLIPVIVTIAVDNTPCFLPYHIHHYLLHFYIFAILTAAALLVSCCYPIPPPSNNKYVSKVCKSLRLICCDGRGFLFSVTLLLTGMVYAAYHNFLFWRIQDLGGKEMVMGLCVSIGAFAEIPMLILSGRLVKRLGHSWMVSVSLFTLALRVLYYAFIPEPWAFLPIELTHGITHTALWFAILSYDDFNVGAALDRSLRSVLSSLYFGIGFSSGSLLAGYIYSAHGSTALFWGCSAVSGGWCVLFSIFQKCIPQKEKVRYIKLLRNDSDNSDEEEDDWLEMALKDH